MSTVLHASAVRFLYGKDFVMAGLAQRPINLHAPREALAQD